MAAFVGLGASLLGGFFQSKPSKARIFLDSQMGWIAEARTAIRFGQGSDRTFLEATLADLDSRETQARAMPKTALIEAGRGGGHPALGEMKSLREEIKRALQTLDQAAPQAKVIGGASQGVTVAAVTAHGSPVPASPSMAQTVVAGAQNFLRTTEGQLTVAVGGMVLLLAVGMAFVRRPK